MSEILVNQKLFDVIVDQLKRKDVSDLESEDTNALLEIFETDRISEDGRIIYFEEFGFSLRRYDEASTTEK